MRTGGPRGIWVGPYSQLILILLRWDGGPDLSHPAAPLFPPLPRPPAPSVVCSSMYCQVLLRLSVTDTLTSCHALCCTLLNCPHQGCSDKLLWFASRDSNILHVCATDASVCLARCLQNTNPPTHPPLCAAVLGSDCRSMPDTCRCTYLTWQPLMAHRQQLQHYHPLRV